MHTGRKPCEHEGRAGVMCLQTKERCRLPANHHELRGEAWSGFSLESLIRNQSRHFDLRVLASRTLSQMSVV